MIVYFGHNEQGHFVDEETGVRRYIPFDLWMQYVQAGAAAGADTTEPLIKLSITERVTLQKFEGDALIETIEV